MFYNLVDGKRVYTLNKEGAMSAHPARFSVEDKFSKQRIEIKRRYNLSPFNDLDSENNKEE